ncbi:MAG: hypothetical protein ACRCT7_08450 [Shewanella sp.]|uniref:hypothetical protein n=1 Tax=Shewanella sp. SNU WT4 TaxID=2590015 RepID=UPI0011274609|nr:hypothetical protein [Shewanella sp. SNU WT4]QDF65460.1 hypothetical protein FJQ87_01170 [Shewanella sp. SNU WT4]
MKGWIIIGTVGAALYYTATTTTLLDTPITAGKSVLQGWHSKIQSLTGTKIIKADTAFSSLKQQVEGRLSSHELKQLDTITVSPESIAQFSEQYCQSTRVAHPVISVDNVRFICDRL